MDMAADRLGTVVEHPRMHFFEGDITINREWIEYNIRKCDVDPAAGRHRHARDLRARAAARLRARLRGEPADRARRGPVQEAPHLSVHVRGVRHVPRRRVRPRELAISSTARSTSRAGSTPAPSSCMDRVIARLRHGAGPQLHALSAVQLDRPGARLDLRTKEGSSRVVTQFLGQIVRGEPIQLVDGGQPEARVRRRLRRHRRADDASSPTPAASPSGRIYNIGNPRTTIRCASSPR